MNAKPFVTMLITSAILFGSVAIARAGGGGLCKPADAETGTCPPPPLVLFDCYLVEDGVNSPFVLETVDQFGTHENVRVRRSRLLCTQTAPNPTVQVGPALNDDFFNRERHGGRPDHLSCYNVEPRDIKPSEIVTITDPFETQTTTLKNLSLVCAPAFKDIVSP